MKEATTLMISKAKPSQLMFFLVLIFVVLSEDKKNPILNRYFAVKNQAKAKKTLISVKMKSNQKAFGTNAVNF